MSQKLDKKRLVIEARQKRKREELQRELDAQMLCKSAVNKILEAVALEIKLHAYREQTLALRHTLDRACDKKDSLIHHLLYLRDVANFQYQRTLGSFCIKAHDIINFFLTDLEDMCKHNDLKTENMLQFAKNELAHYWKAHQNAETHLKLLFYTGHTAADTLAWNTRGYNMVIKDEDSSTYLEIRDRLTNFLEADYCSIWESYKATLRMYVTSTSDIQKQLLKLRKKEQMMAAIIAAQCKKLILRAQHIKRHQMELLSYETGEKQARFRERRRRYRDDCQRVKIKMNRGLEIDRKQINLLVEVSNTTVEYIENAKRKCEKILRLAAECRKYETEREKVLPYGLKTTAESKILHARMSSEKDPLIVGTFATCPLIKLWQRVSSAELSKLALTREKIRLEREIAALESKLAERNYKENVAPKVAKCECAQSEPSKTFSTRPCAGN